MVFYINFIIHCSIKINLNQLNVVVANIHKTDLNWDPDLNWEPDQRWSKMESGFRKMGSGFRKMGSGFRKMGSGFRKM